MTDEAHRFRRCAAEVREIALAEANKADRQRLERIAHDLEAEAERIAARG